MHGMLREGLLYRINVYNIGPVQAADPPVFLAQSNGIAWRSSGTDQSTCERVSGDAEGRR